jgi:hypothetical protein
MGVSWFYTAFGLRLESDWPIPGLALQPGPAAVDVAVRWEASPAWWARLLEMPQELWQTGFPDANGEPGYRLWQVAGGEYFRLRYRDGCQFVLNRECTRLWVSGPAAATPEYFATYLLGPVLGILLRFRGIPCLHGSAVAVAGRVLSLLGSPGAGKSTTAAAFARQGFPVLTDDIVALKEEGGEFLAMPGDSNLCLWPQSVAMLFGSPEALPPVIPENLLEPEWDKRHLDLHAPGYFFQSQPLPLKAIYLLGARDDDAGPWVGPLTWREGFLELLANAYATKLLDAPRRAAEFAALSRLMAQVPVRRVIPRSGAAYLSELCEEILRDFHSLPAFSATPPAAELRENHGL